MATPAVAQETVSRRMFDQFVTWAERKNLVPSPELFETWDVEQNHSQLREQVFGGDQEVYRAGLKALYSRYFYNLSALRMSRPDGKKGTISISPYRYVKEQSAFADITSPKTKQAQRDFMKSKLDSMIDTLIQQSELLGMTRRELLTYIESK